MLLMYIYRVHYSGDLGSEMYLRKLMGNKTKDLLMVLENKLKIKSPLISFQTTGHIVHVLFQLSLRYVILLCNM